MCVVVVGVYRGEDVPNNCNARRAAGGANSHPTCCSFRRLPALRVASGVRSPFQLPSSVGGAAAATSSWRSRRARPSESIAGLPRVGRVVAGGAGAIIAEVLLTTCVLLRLVY